MNLNPDQRTNFLDLMHPPSGYRLEAAVGTTYSFDFVTLTALMLAFVDGERDEADGELNQVEILRAIIRLADRVRLFAHQGRINVELDALKSYGRLSGMYDRLVRGVKLAEGSFHPKVWALHFTPKASAAANGLGPIVRLVCSSRNLTTSSTWEVFVSFDGFVNAQTGSKKLGAEAGAFLLRLRRESARDAHVLEPLAKIFSEAHFQDKSKSGIIQHFHWQWHGQTRLWPNFPQTGSRALVVSPFVRADFLDRLIQGYEHLTLVSTQEELDALSDVFYNKLRPKSDLFVVRPARADNDSDALQLHAKIYFVESPTGQSMFLGSANASESAWQAKNCEAMVSVKPGISMNRFLDEFVFRPPEKDAKHSKHGKVDSDRPTHGWIQKYDRQPQADDESALTDKKLDAAQNAVIRLSFAADFLREQNIFLVTCPDFAAVIPELNGCQLRLCPLTLYKHASVLRPALPLLNGPLDFPAVRLSEVTEFLLMELVTGSAPPRLFVLQAISAFDRIRADRDTAVLEECLKPDSFRRFLQAILLDRVPEPDGSLAGGTAGPPSSGAQAKGIFGDLFGEITLEDVLRACTEDPDRMEEIDQLLRTFEKITWNDDESKLGFLRLCQFWQKFRSAYSKVKEEGA